MRKYMFAFFALIILLVASCSKIKLAYRYYINPCYYDNPVRQNDFPQQFLEINLEDYYEEITSLSKNFQVDIVESIHYNDIEYPIYNIEYIGESANDKMLVLAGVHGNESGGTLAIIELLKDLNGNPDRYNDWHIKIITPVNPAGTVEMSRYNEAGCDLNRKVKSSNQKAIVLQRNIIEEYRPEIIITLHEAPSAGFLIHPGKHLGENLIIKILEDIETKGVVLSDEDYLGRTLDRPGVSKIQGITKLLKNLVQVQSLGDYAAERNIIEITTESGWNSNDRFQRINSHAILIGSVVDNYKNSKR